MLARDREERKKALGERSGEEGAIREKETKDSDQGERGRVIREFDQEERGRGRSGRAR